MDLNKNQKLYPERFCSNAFAAFGKEKHIASFIGVLYFFRISGMTLMSSDG